MRARGLWTPRRPTPSSPSSCQGVDESNLESTLNNLTDRWPEVKVKVVGGCGVPTTSEVVRSVPPPIIHVFCKLTLDRNRWGGWWRIILFHLFFLTLYFVCLALTPAIMYSPGWKRGAGGGGGRWMDVKQKCRRHVFYLYFNERPRSKISFSHENSHVSHPSRLRWERRGIEKCQRHFIFCKSKDGQHLKLFRLHINNLTPSVLLRENQ